MNELSFYKYQGAGNDFILIDNRSGNFALSLEQVTRLCDRKFGIGSDGLMLIEKPTDSNTDFHLEFFNPDGSKSFCGNGSRCAVAFAKKLGVCKDKTSFTAIDGVHSADVVEDNWVSLRMKDVGGISTFRDGFFLNTGSPHVVLEVNDLAHHNVYEEGKKLRYDGEFSPGGTNVNFVHQNNSTHFAVRTYERGVENETLACGTGVVAVALAMHKKYKLSNNEIQIDALGGELSVSFEATKLGYQNIYLHGPATFVFQGEISINN